VVGVRDLLTRFRPAGAPGPAGAAGVPADRRESAAAELAPVFATLAEVDGECDRLRREAVEQAAQRQKAAVEQARVLVARAREGAAAERAAAAARIREDTAAELAQLAATTAAETEAARRRAAQRLPQLLSAVRERVRADLAAAAGLPGRQPGGPP
jgi:hypothetical protein